MPSLRKSPYRAQTNAKSIANLRVWITKLAIVFVLVSCVKENQSPYHEILENGFYAYILPEAILAEHNLTLKTPIRHEEQSWDSQCNGGVSAPDNPLLLFYLDLAGKSGISIRLANNAAPWDHNQPTSAVSLDVPWAPNGTGIVYQDDPNSEVRFEDPLGNHVMIFGDQPVELKIEFINALEYVGPKQSELESPWSASWCEAWH